MQEKIILVVTFFTIIEATIFDHIQDKNEAILTWTSADFLFLNSTIKSNVIRTGQYIKENVIATRFQFWKKKLVAVFPRYKKGVPATVAVTDVYINKHTPTTLWKPFPSRSIHDENIYHCDVNILNAVDIFIDVKDHLWILDSGITSTLEAPYHCCPPKVVVINMITKKIHRVIHLSALTCSQSQAQFLAVEETIKGRTYLYVADAATHSILVWDIHKANGWRIALPNIIIGTTLNSADIMYLVLVHQLDGQSVLYITYLSSPHMFSIRTEFLRHGHNNTPAGRIINEGIKPATMVILGVDGGTNIFFRYEGKSEIYRWNTLKQFIKDNFIKVYDGQHNTRYATHVAPDYDLNKMMVLESNYPDFVKGSIGVGTSHTISPLVN